MTEIKASVILLSYNRQRMIKEAIQSILNQTYQEFECYIYDDGSDFDIWETIEPYKDSRLIVVKAPKISAEEKIETKNARWPENMNHILSLLDPDTFVTYLCDDDLLDHEWLARAYYAFKDFPPFHVVNGRNYYFFDGEDPVAKGRKGFLGDEEFAQARETFWWQCGTFSHLVKCFYECDVKWDTPPDGHSWDIDYIGRIWANHLSVISMPYPACYRREHENNLSVRLGRLKSGKYGKPIKLLEPKDIIGAME